MKYSKSKITPEIMCDIFSIKTVPYNRRNDTTLHCRDADIILYGSEVISSLGPKIWVLLTPKMRNIKFTEEFNKKMREWTQSVVCISCLYRLCKIFIQNIGFHSRITVLQGKGEGISFKSSVPLPPASQTLRH